MNSVHDEIVAGRRGRFGGPFEILIRAPEVCRHLQRLGEYLRWGSSLPPALSELAICLTARHLRVNVEWHAHAPLAVEAGVPAAAIEAIRTGATPSFTAADQILVHRVVTELIDTKRLSDATFAEAISRFGEQGGRRTWRDRRLLHGDRKRAERVSGAAAGGRAATLSRIGTGPHRAHQRNHVFFSDAFSYPPVSAPPSRGSGLRAKKSPGT